ncbi:MAG: uroporphyrinogen-III C-methyltransferase [Candidatus Cyclobacteriaceae bacterium M3_2C_046]
MVQSPKLTLVGAGPGDPELITIKAIKALKQADIILYDALVNTALLDYVPSSTPKIFVGKRAGIKKYDQPEINEMIVRCAFSHGHVVRLKGGDPFVFGRGKEELEYAEAHGLETAVVPGISSALAVPALQKIPLTERGCCESFWVITGTTKDHQLSGDIAIAAQTSATVIILMGMKKLSQIMKIYQEADKSELPVAIIQHGSWDHEISVSGTVRNIMDEVATHKIGSPAIIVIGEVVKKARFQSLVNQQLQQSHYQAVI